MSDVNVVGRRSINSGELWGGPVGERWKCTREAVDELWGAMWRTCRGAMEVRGTMEVWGTMEV